MDSHDAAPSEQADEERLCGEVARFHISAEASVGAYLASDADYHRYGAGGHGALVALVYEVSPPLS